MHYALYIINYRLRPMKTMNVGIIGAGWIAEKAAITLNHLSDISCYAIASRSQEKADAFAAQWGCKKAYGSYSALLDDPDVDLVYVATPHRRGYMDTLSACSADGEKTDC